MTPEEITAMAKEAHGPITSQWWDMDVAALQRFAALVAEKAAAKEREACAQLCEGHMMPFTHCNVSMHAVDMTVVALAHLIRARGQKGGV